MTGSSWREQENEKLAGKRERNPKLNQKNPKGGNARGMQNLSV